MLALLIVSATRVFAESAIRLAIDVRATAAGPALRIASPHPSRVPPIPAFARMYRTGCSTCHIAAPKLNVLGEVFRLNGYRLPASDLLVRRDDPVPLGAPPWREEWPRSIWPGDLPGQLPVAVRIQSDMYATRDEAAASSFSYEFPHEIYLLAGTPFGESAGAFVEATWSPAEGVEVKQAKVTFQDVWPGRPDWAPDLWLGLLDPALFSFADRQTDRAARQRFTWQDFDIGDVEVVSAAGESVARSGRGPGLGGTMPAVEIDGTLRRRLQWGLGLAQGRAVEGADINSAKDVYYKLRLKLGGLDLGGRYSPGGGPVAGAGGQLLDRSVTVEHFGYFGNDSSSAAPAGAHRAFGLAVRVLEGRLDAGAGWVRHRWDSPWAATAPAGHVTARSAFAKLEYLVFPWVLASVKAERFDVDLPASFAPQRLTTTGHDVTRIMPGLVALIRQNVRAVAEVEWFLDNASTDLRSERRPHTLWLRLDLAF